MLDSMIIIKLLFGLAIICMMIAVVIPTHVDKIKVGEYTPINHVIMHATSKIITAMVLVGGVISLAIIGF